MANNSCIGFCMRNQKLFQELKKIGINFSNDGRECKLTTGEAYEFYFEDGDNTPYLGFNHDYMINIYLEYFLGCGNSKFNYQFMKILTENDYFKSDYDFKNNPFDKNQYYDYDFFKQFHPTKKLTDFDGFIKEAYVESVEFDGEVTAFRAAVTDGIMTISDLQFEIEEDFFFDVSEFWDEMDEETKNEFSIQKTFKDGYWI